MRGFRIRDDRNCNEHRDVPNALVMLARRNRSRLHRTEGSDQDSPFPLSILFRHHPARCSTSAESKSSRSNRSAPTVRFVSTCRISVALSAFALTVASTAMNVRIESPWPFAFVVHQIVHRPKKRKPASRSAGCSRDGREQRTDRAR